MILSNINEDVIYTEVKELLRELGFDFDNYGTMYLAETILALYYSLSMCTTEKDIDTLYTFLLNNYSQFYKDVARNNNDMGIKSFLKKIESSMNNRFLNKKDMSLEKKLFNNNLTVFLMNCVNYLASKDETNTLVLKKTKNNNTR